MSGADGNPWTWVMGEHCDDKSIEEILEAEAHLQANNMAKMQFKYVHAAHFSTFNNIFSAS